MLRKVRNEIYSLITQNGLNPMDFVGRYDTNFNRWYHFTISLRTYPELFFTFTYDSHDGGWKGEYTGVSDKFPPIQIERDLVANWSELEVVQDYFVQLWLQRHVKHFQRFSQILEDDEKLVDLWGLNELAESALIEESGGLDRPSFSTEHLDRVALSLKEIRERILEQKVLNDDQILQLDEKLDYLLDASRRMGTKDWGVLVAGTLINLIMQASLSAEAAKVLWNTAASALSWLGHQPHLLM